MTLEVEGHVPVANPTEEAVTDAVTSLNQTGPTYASLTDEFGNFVQVVGGRPWCMVEWRQKKPPIHKRANADAVRRPYEDGAAIHFSAGPVPLRADEWLLQKQAAEIFKAFLRREDFPEFVRWRLVNAQLGLSE